MKRLLCKLEVLNLSVLDSRDVAHRKRPYIDNFNKICEIEKGKSKVKFLNTIEYRIKTDSFNSQTVSETILVARSNGAWVLTSLLKKNIIWSGLMIVSGSCFIVQADSNEFMETLKTPNSMCCDHASIANIMKYHLVQYPTRFLNLLLNFLLADSISIPCCTWF